MRIRSLLWGVVTACAVAVPTLAQEPMSRAAFDRALRQNANPRSLGTDVAGAWDNIYQYLIPARLLDRKAYEQALLNLAAGEPCAGARTRSAKLSCAANGAARAAGSFALYAEAVEWRRDAVQFAEEGARTNPGPLLDSLILLAFDELRLGSLADADATVRQATELMNRDRRLATAQRQFRVAVLNARLADARLDDSTAVQWLRLAVTAAPQVDAVTSADDPLARLPLDDLLVLHLAGRFCAGCGTPIAGPVRDYLRGELGKGGSAEYLLLALAAPAGAFARSELARFAASYLKELPSADAVRLAQRLRGRMDETEVARLLALAQVVSPAGNPAQIVAFFNENDRARQAEAGRKLLAIEQQNADETGAILMLLEQLPQTAWFLEQAGLRRPARIVLEFLIESQKGSVPSGALVSPAMIKLASIFGPAFTRLAALQLSDGDRDAARRSLMAADEIAVARLRGEWNRGSENAILAIRDLSDSLHLAAHTWHALAAPSGPAERSADAERVFRAMQLATFGETALTLGIAAQRRAMARPEAAELHSRALRATAEAERYAQIAQNLHRVDVDNVLTRTRDRAAAEAAQLREQLASVLPGTTLDGSEISPAELRAVSGRLGAGEAFVVLRVGATTLDGFLVDRAGGSLVWSTQIGAAEVEDLVRALRDSAEVPPTAPFPFEQAHNLYQAAFGPVAPQLRRYSKLVVLGNGPLQSMPYGMLLTAMPPTLPANAEQFRAAAPAWLIRSHAIAIMPSVPTFVAQRSAAAAGRAKKPFLGIGNPVLAPVQTAGRKVNATTAFTPGTPGGLADVNVLRQQPSLPETEDELRTIARLLRAGPDDIIVQTKATEANVKQLPLADYAIVSFATHGALAGEARGSSEPGLILTPPPTATPEDDGFLALSDVQALKFDADLVILSACNTGTSDGRPRAEGLSGLARGFFRAGARSLLVTHWAIPSESSVKLITGVIEARERDKRLDWADALRASSLALIDREGPAEWAHPAYWAGFAAVGVTGR